MVELQWYLGQHSNINSNQAGIQQSPGIYIYEISFWLWIGVLRLVVYEYVLSDPGLC